MQKENDKKDKPDENAPNTSSWSDLFTFKSDSISVKYDNIAAGVKNAYSFISDKTNSTSTTQTVENEKSSSTVDKTSFISTSSTPSIVQKEENKFDGSGLSVVLSGVCLVFCLFAGFSLRFERLSQANLVLEKQTTTINVSENNVGENFNNLLACTHASNQVCNLPDNIRNQATKLSPLEAKDLLKEDGSALAISSGDNSGIKRVYILSQQKVTLNYVNAYDFGSSGNMMNFFINNNVRMISDGSQNDLTAGEKAVGKGLGLLFHLVL